jgi:hypothetical protein
MTAAHRVAALVPRMNKVLDAARRLHMQVLWAPTAVVSDYVGTKQREAALGVPLFPMPAVSPLACPLSVKGKDCMCGPGIACIRNFGWDGMQPGLRIDPADRITLGAAELYSNSKQLGLTHLIYMGVHTNACIINRPEGIRAIAPTGLKCMLARDLTDALTDYNPETGFTPDTGTIRTIEDIERAGIPSIDLGAEMKRVEAWQDDVVVDPLMITPWGSESTPYFFTDATTVTLSAPGLGDTEIRYTLDGAFPGPASLLYNAPLRLTGPAHIRAAAYRGSRRVSLVAEGEFARLGPMPPSPDVQLDEVKPMPAAKADPAWPVKTGEAFNGGPLRVRRRTYAHGLGMRAPAGVVYEIQPSYDRFVARAGVDDDPYRQADRASHLAIHCSVRFKVFIDGKLAAESPVMRLSQEPWRFDVKLPEGSRRLSLAVTDAGSRSPLDLADWVEVGFVLKK